MCSSAAGKARQQRSLLGLSPRAWVGLGVVWALAALYRSAPLFAPPPPPAPPVADRTAYVQALERASSSSAASSAPGRAPWAPVALEAGDWVVYLRVQKTGSQTLWMTLVDAWDGSLWSPSSKCVRGPFCGHKCEDVLTKAFRDHKKARKCQLFVRAARELFGPHTFGKAWDYDFTDSRVSWPDWRRRAKFADREASAAGDAALLAAALKNLDRAAGTNDVGARMSADAEDESLRKYKEQLLGAAAKGDLGDTSDPRKLIVVEFRIAFNDATPDLVFNLDTLAGKEKLKKTGVSIKEGAEYKFKLSFRVQHEILAGLKFCNKTKKMGMSQSDELMIGSYPPGAEPHVFEVPATTGWRRPRAMYRGSYTATDKFVDSDGKTHLEYSYPLKVTK
ncbi:Rho GDP-dissociation inhibitor [Aureococcus anophagefferens]|uniref:Rho GDP-dissociation inhibitor n=1 Tax=Aureococcus anophagefferens TaxID=44056 RepID=A0ABR1G6Q9_AURAN